MKNNKGFIGIGLIIAIIIGALAIGGVAYYAGKSSSTPSQNTQGNNYQPQTDQNNNVPFTNNATNTPAQNNSVNNTTTTTTTVTTTKGGCTSTTTQYKNSKGGYLLCYPSNWQVPKITTSASYDDFNIKNNSDAVLNGTDFSMKSNGSLVDVSVTYNMNYKDIAEFTKDSKLPQASQTFCKLFKPWNNTL
jgi:hypothetical protein